MANLLLVMWTSLDAHSILVAVSCLYQTIVLIIYTIIISEHEVLIINSYHSPLTRSPYYNVYLFGGVCCDALN